ncbi:hypothetical protein [Henriciella sp.]|uniref:hypothetical protein n=1 Tax=Henriciella sp. TaxID=1968823 RepID=UPI0026249C84|nr:hypothetical protein [Henriciella sp.]
MEHAIGNEVVLARNIPKVWSLFVPLAIRPDWNKARLSEGTVKTFAPVLKHLTSSCACDVLVMFPGWEPVVSAMEPDLIVYDRLDDHAGFEHVRASIAEDEERLFKQAGLISVSHNALKPDLTVIEAPCVTVRNGVDPLSLSAVSFSSEREPCAIYVGAVESWFDWELLCDVATQLPAMRFDIIGQVSGIPDPPLPRNIRLLGERRHEEAMMRLTKASVGIVPFYVTPFTRTINAVKIYEYLGAGLPVVTTAFLDQADTLPFVHRAEDAGAFAAAIEVAHAEAEADEDTRRMASATVDGASWQARATTLLDAMKQARGRRKNSIRPPDRS